MKRKCAKSYYLEVNDVSVIFWHAGLVYDIEYLDDKIAIARGFKIPAETFDPNDLVF